MNPIKERKIKVQNVLRNIINIIREEAIKQRGFISDLNREQLLQGKTSDGLDMPNYVDGSKQPSAPGKITLFAIGDFHQGIEPLFEDVGFEMIGTDSKTGFLVSKFVNSLGLNAGSILKLRAKMLPNIKKRVTALI